LGSKKPLCFFVSLEVLLVKGWELLLQLAVYKYICPDEMSTP